MTNPLTMRDAEPQDAPQMSALAIRSKAHWGYSKEFIEACREELSVSPENIKSDKLRYVVAEYDHKLVGYYAIETCPGNGYELEALFVEPGCIGKGFGKSLMEHAKLLVIASGGKTLTIQGDPNAAKFYLAAGGKKIGTRESASISGRSLPLFEIDLENGKIT